MKNLLSKQYLLLAFTNFSSIGIALITNILITTILSENDFGSYRYIINLITMIVSLTNLGVYYSTARLLTNANKNREKELYGATFSIMSIISISVGIILFVILRIIDSYLTNVRFEIYLALPFIFTVMLQRMFMSILKGSNKIFDICLQTLIPQLILVLLYSIIKLFKISNLSFMIALFIYVFSFSVTHIITIFRLKISPIVGLKKEFKNIYYEQKNNGFEIYKGSLLAVFTADLLNVIIGTVSTKASFASYSLALSFSTPILQIPAMMGIVNFKKNARRDNICKKDITKTIILSIITYILLNLGIHTLFPLVYKSLYLEVPKYVILLSLGYVLHGMGDYINNFLNAHGKGIDIKKSSIYTGIFQLIFSIIMIPKFEIMGLIFTRLLTSLIYLLCMIYAYIKLTKNHRNMEYN